MSSPYSCSEPLSPFAWHSLRVSQPLHVPGSCALSHVVLPDALALRETPTAAAEPPLGISGLVGQTRCWRWGLSGLKDKSEVKHTLLPQFLNCGLWLELNGEQRGR